MAIKIGLLSGKGGSGKTTLGLSMANFLSDNQERVLFIDCDLATNGATYFFEKKFFADELTLNLIKKGIGSEKNVLQINSFFDFIPTSTYFPYVNNQSMESDKNFINFIQTIEEYYKIIIFDCQAGYSEWLRSILTVTDINLIVLELDAISSSAIRVLYKQVSDLLESKPTYQIFNKISEEDKTIYDKVTTGTIFTSLPPVLFSWNIRRYFAYAKMPELDQENLKFSLAVYDILKIILEDYIVNWQHESFLQNVVAPEKNNLLKTKTTLMGKRKRRRKENRKRTIIAECTNAVMIGLFSITLMLNSYFNNVTTNIIYMLAILLFFLYGFILIKKQKMYETDLFEMKEKEINEEILKCEEEIKTLLKYL